MDTAFCEYCVSTHRPRFGQRDPAQSELGRGETDYLLSCGVTEAFRFYDKAGGYGVLVSPARSSHQGRKRGAKWAQTLNRRFSACLGAAVSSYQMGRGLETELGQIVETDGGR